MKSKLLLAVTAGLLLCSTKQKAQVSAYSFSQTLGSYGPANTGTLVGGVLQDDDVNTVALPFSFLYNGTTYSSMDVCANGYMCFVTNTITGTEYNPISDNTTENLIAPFGQDLFMGSVILADMATGSNTLINCSSVNGYSVGDVLFDYNLDFGGINPTVTAVSGSSIVLNINAQNSNTSYDIINMNGYIKQNVSGTSPNRVCEFEFANFTRISVTDEVITFKLRLYETSNKIEFVYGTMIPGQYATPSEVGLKGNNTSDFNSRKVNSPVTWSVSVASTFITDNCDFNTTAFPISGQSYLWSPVTCTVPLLTITPSSSIICSGQSATLTAGGATSYTWANGPTTSQQTVTPLVTTNYTLIGANTTCTSSLTYTQNVAQNPTLSITQTKTVICTGQSATLVAGGATTYSWNGVVSPAQLVVSPTVTTSYSLAGTNGTCSAATSIVQNVMDCTGISEISAKLEGNSITAYPNPFNTSLHIKNTAAKDQSITISDALGKAVYTTVIKAESTETVQGDFLNSGLYFISVSGDNGSPTKKLIKQ